MLTMRDINVVKKLETNDELFKETYFELLNVLRENIVYVEFRKKNGELREMYCTRHPGYVGVFYEGNSNNNDNSVTAQDLNNRLIRIFDMDKDAFRSFNIDSLVDFEIDSYIP